MASFVLLCFVYHSLRQINSIAIHSQLGPTNKVVSNPAPDIQ